MRLMNLQAPWQQEAVIQQSQRLWYSFQHWTGRSLFETQGAAVELAQQMFEAPFVLISHGTEPDPIFNYANRQASALWELSWEQFTQMPSRLAAEPLRQEERDRLLAETAAKGFVSNFSAIRISSTGKRFQIENAVIWNVVDEKNQPHGQAAAFWNYKFID
jgi:hypothetical protein